METKDSYFGTGLILFVFKVTVPMDILLFRRTCETEDCKSKFVGCLFNCFSRSGRRRSMRYSWRLRGDLVLVFYYQCHSTEPAAVPSTPPDLTILALILRFVKVSNIYLMKFQVRVFSLHVKNFTF